VPRADPRRSYPVVLQRHTSSHCDALEARHGHCRNVIRSLCMLFLSDPRDEVSPPGMPAFPRSIFPQTWNPMPQRDRFSQPHDKQITFPPRCCAFCRPANRGNCHSFGARVGSGGERHQGSDYCACGKDGPRCQRCQSIRLIWPRIKFPHMHLRAEISFDEESLVLVRLWCFGASLRLLPCFSKMKMCRRSSPS
jgi:hypothetical protein